MHYGLTEAARSAFIEFHQDRAHLDTVGVPAPGVQVEIRDEHGNLCARGILWVDGARVSPGYWDDPSLSTSVFASGWTRTGDVAHLEAGGYIHLHGREDDMVNTGGNKVAPDEVERVLAGPNIRPLSTAWRQRCVNIGPGPSRTARCGIRGRLPFQSVVSAHCKGEMAAGS